ncbi:MAG: signal peptidase I [Eubacteriales bacterium]|nr:signal peptidase I [Eubacteriales bacterium]
MPNRSPPIRIVCKVFTLLFIITIIITCHLNCSFLIVLSGSMEPKIPTGSVICLHKNVQKFNIGDVVTYECGTPVNDQYSDFSHTEFVTHRICDVIEKDKKSYFRTKGDANKDPDGILITPNEIQGKVLFAIPYLGYWIVYLRTHSKMITIFVFIILSTLIYLNHLGIRKKQYS